MHERQGPRPEAPNPCRLNGEACGGLKPFPVKGTEIVSGDRVPRITYSAMGRPEGFSAEKGDYSTWTITLTIRFWVEGSNRDAIMDVMQDLRKTFPHTDFRVLEFAGNI